MAHDADRLRAFNTQIREAAIRGAVEDMVVLIERRRQFLDGLTPSKAEGSAALIAALNEAARDNADLVQGLEREMEQARARGKVTLQARKRYHKTQSTL